MSTTVTYKGATLTTAENETRTLLTSGKYLEDNITITDVTSGGGGAEQLYVLVAPTGYGSTDVMIDGSYGTTAKAYYKTGLSSGALITVYTWGDYILDTVTGMTSGTTIPYTTVSRGTYTFTMPDESVYCSLLYDD